MRELSAVAMVLVAVPALGEVPSSGPPVREVGDLAADPGLSARARDEDAWRSKGDEVRTLFREAGVSFPPRRLLLRVFKREGLLEVWAEDSGRAARVATYRICRGSGGPGPKRRAGDRQVPEGFYKVAVLNPASRFHLSLGIDYPNASDRVHANRRNPGGAIMIHGSCVSIGCIAMGDDRIRELWVMASAMRRAGRTTEVHIYPARDVASLAAAATDPGVRGLWTDLAAAMRLMDATGRIPRVHFDTNGRHRFR